MDHGPIYPLIFCEPLPNGKYILAEIDDYSRYPVTEFVESTSSISAIPVLDKILSAFGIPEVIKTDNGPPFNGSEFEKFTKYLEFKHRKITPRWPQANGEAEKFMQPLMKSIRTATIESVLWNQALEQFLRNHRAIPYYTTGKPPASILFRYTARTNLPQISNDTMIRDQQIRDRGDKQKTIMKDNYDKRKKVTIHNFEIGDKVIVKKPRQRKTDSLYNPSIYKIVLCILNSMITVQKKFILESRYVEIAHISRKYNVISFCKLKERCNIVTLLYYAMAMLSI